MIVRVSFVSRIQKEMVSDVSMIKKYASPTNLKMIDEFWFSSTCVSSIDIDDGITQKRQKDHLAQKWFAPMLKVDISMCIHYRKKAIEICFLLICWCPSDVIWWWKKIHRSAIERLQIDGCWRCCGYCVVDSNTGNPRKRVDQYFCLYYFCLL